MNQVNFTIEEAQEVANYIAQIIDPKHSYRLKKYRRTCAFVWEAIAERKRRTIGVTPGTLNNHSFNGLVRVLAHEITHFLHAQKYRNRLELLWKHRSHRKSFKNLEAKTLKKLEDAYGERLPVNCWDD